MGAWKINIEGAEYLFNKDIQYLVNVNLVDPTKDDVKLQLKYDKDAEEDPKIEYKPKRRGNLW